jgi:carbon-monoxide dehydrogenase small subunit
LAVQADGHRVTTVEGLTEHRTTRSLTAALAAAHGLQCGFCTAGFLVSATELLDESDGAELTDRDVRAALSGNLCRCTGYQGIIEAVRRAARDSAGVQAAEGATPPSQELGRNSRP